jgi:flagellar hook-basal body complex protein FliE
MKIELSSAVLEAINASRSSMASGFTPGVNGEAGVGFAQAMKHAITHVEGRQHAADMKVTAVESGQSDDLIGAMLASQEANLSFSMMMQVRNKLMAAFDDVIKMQV